jgi:hypothetical protein
MRKNKNHEHKEVFTFNCFEEMLESIYLYPYQVEEYINPIGGRWGVRCPVSGRIWECRLSDIKKASKIIAADLLKKEDMFRNLMCKLNRKPMKPRTPTC